MPDPTSEAFLRERYGLSRAQLGAVLGRIAQEGWPAAGTTQLIEAIRLAPGAAAMSPQSAHVTGRVLEVEGGKVSVADGWQHGPAIDKGARWDPAELGPVVDELRAEAPSPAPVYGAS